MAFPVLQPDEWRMRWARPPHEHTAMPVGEVYVHQTAGRDPVALFPSGDDKPGDAFFALNEYAINTKGYSAIDYSMLVHTGPSLRTTIGVARGQWVPAATLHRNTESKAVCLCGWFGPPDPRYPWTYDNSRVPFRQELEAIAESIVLMVHEGWVLPTAKILGHRDNPMHLNATGCPGDYLYAELPTIRTLVARLLTTEVPPMATLARSVRIFDSRGAQNGGRKVAPGSVTRVGVLDPPAWASAAIVDIGVDQPAGRGFITAWDGRGDRPNTSVQDFEPGAARSNLWHVPLDGNGFSVYSHAETHLVVDLVGWDSVV